MDASDRPLANTAVSFHWLKDVQSGSPVEEDMVARTGSDGRFVNCSLPAGGVVRVKAELDGAWVDLFEEPMPPGEVVFRRVMVPMR